MSVYRYFATDLITGATRADQLPLRVESFGRNLGGVGQPGQLRGSLDLGASAFQSYMVAALEPRRTLLWATQDAYPVWAGVLWDTPHQSAASNLLPVVADEIGSLFAKRQVRADQVYTGVDLHVAIRNLINYGTGKTNGAVAQLVHSTSLNGTTTSVTFPASNLGYITPLLDQFCGQYGLEYAYDPGLNSVGQPIITLRIGTASTMGRSYTSTQLQLRYPGNLADYSWPRMGSSSVNSVLAVAGNAGGAAWASNFATHGLDSSDLALGYPILEGSVSYTGSVITAQSQIDAYADARVQTTTHAPTTPTAVIAGGQSPTVQQIVLGDHAGLIATSSLHPGTPGPPPAPGLIQDVRIIGWKVYPPGENQAERTELVLAGVTS